MIKDLRFGGKSRELDACAGHVFVFLRGAAAAADRADYLAVPINRQSALSWNHALDEPERSEFESVYADLVAEAYPKQPGGTTIFPFRRLFIVAKR